MDKKTKESLVNHVVGAIIVYFLVRVAIYPGYLAYVYFTRRSAANDLSEGRNGRYSFWLEQSERQRFMFLSQHLGDALVSKNKAIEEAESLGLPKTNAGTYVRHSTAGKKITDTIRRSDEIIEAAQAEIDFLSEKPRREWAELNEKVKESSAGLGGLIVMGISFAVFSQLISPPRGFSDQPWIAYAIAWYISIAIAGIARSLIPALSSRPISKIYDEPPLVTKKNVFSYDPCPPPLPVS